MNHHNRITALDSLRGIAALMVCLFHFDVFNNGSTGVDLFFMISGFVIFMSLANSSNIKGFWIARLIRLFPTYWLSILIAIIIAKTFTSYGLISQTGIRFYVGNILMLQPLFNTPNLLGSYWTLYVELLFYFSLSFIFFTQLNKHIELVITAGLILVIGVNVGYYYFGHSPAYEHFYIVIRHLNPLIIYFPSFAAGIVFYIIYNSGFNFYRVLLLISIICITAITHRYSIMINMYVTSIAHVTYLLLYYLAFVTIVFKWDTLLKLRPLIILGEISYAFYLIHESTALVLNYYLQPVIGGLMAKTLSILITLLVAYIITRYFDLPLRGFLKNKLSPNRKTAPYTIV